MKSEWEKMISGELYDSSHDEDLQARQKRSKSLCMRINSLPLENEKDRDILLRELLGKSGDNLTIMPDFWCDYGENIEIGDNFYANHGLVILDCAKVKIGSYVKIAPNVVISTATHPLDSRLRREEKEYALPITISDDVWIGSGAQILPGVMIGKGAVIGAGSVVNRDVEAYTVIGGVPARFIKRIKN